MQVTETIASARRAVETARKQGCKIGLVPTMGALHAGHQALIAEARRGCDYLAVSLFVNPLQFGPTEDFSQYPRTWEADRALCEAEHCDLIFCPSSEEMYAPDRATSVTVAGLTEGLCGASRPGHFDGVTTVVGKLFNIVQPDRAWFGQKDYQQLQVIRRMVRDLNFPIEIIGCPTVREADGLAISSRNQYLDAEERRSAPILYRAMQHASARIAGGELDAATLQREISREITATGRATIDYIEFVDPETLRPLGSIDRPARLCLAVRIGRTRLIDNLPVDANGPQH